MRRGRCLLRLISSTLLLTFTLTNTIGFSGTPSQNFSSIPSSSFARPVPVGNNEISLANFRSELKKAGLITKNRSELRTNSEATQTEVQSIGVSFTFDYTTHQLQIGGIKLHVEKGYEGNYPVLVLNKENNSWHQVASERRKASFASNVLSKTILLEPRESHWVAPFFIKLRYRPPLARFTRAFFGQNLQLTILSFNSKTHQVTVQVDEFAGSLRSELRHSDEKILPANKFFLKHLNKLSIAEATQELKSKKHFKEWKNLDGFVNDLINFDHYASPAVIFFLSLRENFEAWKNSLAPRLQDILKLRFETNFGNRTTWDEAIDRGYGFTAPTGDPAKAARRREKVMGEIFGSLLYQTKEFFDQEFSPTLGYLLEDKKKLSVVDYEVEYDGEASPFLYALKPEQGRLFAVRIVPFDRRTQKFQAPEPWIHGSEEDIESAFQQHSDLARGSIIQAVYEGPSSRSELRAFHTIKIDEEAYARLSLRLEWKGLRLLFEDFARIGNTLLVSDMAFYFSFPDLLRSFLEDLNPAQRLFFEQRYVNGVSDLETLGSFLGSFSQPEFRIKEASIARDQIINKILLEKKLKPFQAQMAENSDLISRHVFEYESTYSDSLQQHLINGTSELVSWLEIEPDQLEISAIRLAERWIRMPEHFVKELLMNPVAAISGLRDEEQAIFNSEIGPDQKIYILYQQKTEALRSELRSFSEHFKKFLEKTQSTIRSPYFMIILILAALDWGTKIGFSFYYGAPETILHQSTTVLNSTLWEQIAIGAQEVYAGRISIIPKLGFSLNHHVVPAYIRMTGFFPLFLLYFFFHYVSPSKQISRIERIKKIGFSIFIGGMLGNVPEILLTGKATNWILIKNSIDQGILIANLADLFILFGILTFVPVRIIQKRAAKKLLKNKIKSRSELRGKELKKTDWEHLNTAERKQFLENRISEILGRDFKLYVTKIFGENDPYLEQFLNLLSTWVDRLPEIKQKNGDVRIRSEKGTVPFRGLVVFSTFDRGENLQINIGEGKPLRVNSLTEIIAYENGFVALRLKKQTSGAIEAFQNLIQKFNLDSGELSIPEALLTTEDEIVMAEEFLSSLLEVVFDVHGKLWAAAFEVAGQRVLLQMEQEKSNKEVLYYIFIDENPDGYAGDIKLFLDSDMKVESSEIYLSREIQEDYPSIQHILKLWTYFLKGFRLSKSNLAHFLPPQYIKQQFGLDEPLSQSPVYRYPFDQFGKTLPNQSKESMEKVAIINVKRTQTVLPEDFPYQNEVLETIIERFIGLILQDENFWSRINQSKELLVPFLFPPSPFGLNFIFRLSGTASLDLEIALRETNNKNPEAAPYNLLYQMQISFRVERSELRNHDGANLVAVKPQIREGTEVKSSWRHPEVKRMLERLTVFPYGPPALEILGNHLIFEAHRQVYESTIYYFRIIFASFFEKHKLTAELYYPHWKEHISLNSTSKSEENLNDRSELRLQFKLPDAQTHISQALQFVDSKALENRRLVQMMGDWALYQNYDEILPSYLELVFDRYPIDLQEVKINWEQFKNEASQQGIQETSLLLALQLYRVGLRLKSWVEIEVSPAKLEEIRTRFKSEGEITPDFLSNHLVTEVEQLLATLQTQFEEGNKADLVSRRGESAFRLPEKITEIFREKWRKLKAEFPDASDDQLHLIATRRLIERVSQLSKETDEPEARDVLELLKLASQVLLRTSERRSDKSTYDEPPALVHSSITADLIRWEFFRQFLISSKNNRSELRATATLLQRDHARRSVVDHIARLARDLQVGQTQAEHNSMLDGFLASLMRTLSMFDSITFRHSVRVTWLVLELAKAYFDHEILRGGPGFDIETVLRRLKFGTLLHDIGKVGIPHELLNKATKLYPHELDAIMQRFEQISLLRQLAIAHLNGDGEAAKAEILNETNRLKQLVETANKPGYLNEEVIVQLEALNKKIWLNQDGESRVYLTDHELEELLIPRGTLTIDERKEIESHVVKSVEILKQIKLTSDLEGMLEEVGAHHERLNGTGYPNQLKGDEIPIGAQIMAIADLWDALTDPDRPYKNGMTYEAAVSILQKQAQDGALNPVLVEIFIKGEIGKMLGFKSPEIEFEKMVHAASFRSELRKMKQWSIVSLSRLIPSGAKEKWRAKFFRELNQYLAEGAKSLPEKPTREQQAQFLEDSGVQKYVSDWIKTNEWKLKWILPFMVDYPREDEEYHRNMASKHERFSIFTHVWKPGGKSRIHHHDGMLALTSALSHGMSEDIFELAEDPRDEKWNGKVVYLKTIGNRKANPGEVHELLRGSGSIHRVNQDRSGYGIMLEIYFWDEPGGGLQAINNPIPIHSHEVMEHKLRREIFPYYVRREPTANLTLPLYRQLRKGAGKIEDENEILRLIEARKRSEKSVEIYDEGDGAMSSLYSTWDFIRDYLTMTLRHKHVYFTTEGSFLLVSKRSELRDWAGRQTALLKHQTGIASYLGVAEEDLTKWHVSKFLEKVLRTQKMNQKNEMFLKFFYAQLIREIVARIYDLNRTSMISHFILSESEGFWGDEPFEQAREKLWKQNIYVDDLPEAGRILIAAKLAYQYDFRETGIRVLIDLMDQKVDFPTAYHLLKEDFRIRTIPIDNYLVVQILTKAVLLHQEINRSELRQQGNRPSSLVYEEKTRIRRFKISSGDFIIVKFAQADGRERVIKIQVSNSKFQDETQFFIRGADDAKARHYWKTPSRNKKKKDISLKKAYSLTVGHHIGISFPDGSPHLVIKPVQINHNSYDVNLEIVPEGKIAAALWSEISLEEQRKVDGAIEKSSTSRTELREEGALSESGPRNEDLRQFRGVRGNNPRIQRNKRPGMLEHRMGEPRLPSSNEYLPASKVSRSTLPLNEGRLSARSELREKKYAVDSIQFSRFAIRGHKSLQKKAESEIGKHIITTLEHPNDRWLGKPLGHIFLTAARNSMYFRYNLVFDKDALNQSETAEVLFEITKGASVVAEGSARVRSYEYEPRFGESPKADKASIETLQDLSPAQIQKLLEIYLNREELGKFQDTTYFGQKLEISRFSEILRNLFRSTKLGKLKVGSVQVTKKDFLANLRKELDTFLYIDFRHQPEALIAKALVKAELLVFKEKERKNPRSELRKENFDQLNAANAALHKNLDGLKQAAVKAANEISTPSAETKANLRSELRFLTENSKPFLSNAAIILLPQLGEEASASFKVIQDTFGETNEIIYFNNGDLDEAALQTISPKVKIFSSFPEALRYLRRKGIDAFLAIGLKQDNEFADRLIQFLKAKEIAGQKRIFDSLDQYLGLVKVSKRLVQELKSWLFKAIMA